MLELKSQRIWDSLKGIDIEDPKIQEELKKAFEEGLERFKKNPESFDEIAKVLTVGDVKKGIVKDGVRYFPESDLYGSGKHGINWEGGFARAKETGNPQGQFGSLEDIQDVVKKASEMGVGKEKIFDWPNNASFVWKIIDDKLTKVPAKKLYVKVYPTGKVHAYPGLDDLKLGFIK